MTFKKCCILLQFETVLEHQRQECVLNVWVIGRTCPCCLHASPVSFVSSQSVGMYHIPKIGAQTRVCRFMFACSGTPFFQDGQFHDRRCLSIYKKSTVAFTVSLLSFGLLLLTCSYDRHLGLLLLYPNRLLYQNPLHEEAPLWSRRPVPIPIVRPHILHTCSVVTMLMKGELTSGATDHHKLLTF